MLYCEDLRLLILTNKKMPKRRHSQTDSHAYEMMAWNTLRSLQTFAGLPVPKKARYEGGRQIVDKRSDYTMKSDLSSNPKKIFSYPMSTMADAPLLKKKNAKGERKQVWKISFL